MFVRFHTFTFKKSHMKRIVIVFLTLLCTFNQLLAQLPSYLPVLGLNAWFPFTGNAVDSTMHGHDGTVYGATMAKGRYGTPNTAYSFNGTSNYIYVPPSTAVKEISVDITSSLTISAWVKSYDYTFSSQEQIYWRGDPTSAHDPHMLYINGGQVLIRRDVDPGTLVRQVGHPVSGLDTNFHMFTGTYDSASGYMCIYIDGVLKNKQYLPGTQSYPTTTMYNYIGAVDGGTWQFFYGIIDELGIWNRALSPCEVAALYYSVSNIITQHPVNDTTPVGGSAGFSVNVSAFSPTYQWQVNTTTGFVNLSNTPPYSGVFTPTLTVTPTDSLISGKTYRCLISSDSCLGVASDSAKLIVSGTLDLSNINDISDIVISPNPNSGTFFIEGKWNNELSIEVTDVLGKIIHSGKIPVSPTIAQKQISLNSRLSNGLYFIKTTSGNSLLVKRMCIQR